VGLKVLNFEELFLLASPLLRWSVYFSLYFLAT